LELTKKKCQFTTPHPKRERNLNYFKLLFPEERTIARGQSAIGDVAEHGVILGEKKEKQGV